ncbi:MAG: thymidine phosphorylase [Gaiellales bacterium]
MRPAELIARKRDGGELADSEIHDLVLGYVNDEVADYQMAAFLMAVYFQGLSADETTALNDAMVDSGATVDLASLGRVVVDKHSTGGVGDKTSIALGPVVAACGVPFAKMSGRGLGHTGGTLDKLESIPGFRVELGAGEFVEQVADIGLAIIGQTANLVPADAKLYALRDVTATVGNTSLIASSIMSKKIAAGAGAILLDVKVGAGAFMKTVEEARELAETMLDLGRRAGRSVAAELTDMGQPLGRAVGNALEIREVIETLEGSGPSDFVDLVASSAGRLLALSDLGLGSAAGEQLARGVLDDGSALELYERWIRRQGGDPSTSALPAAPIVSGLEAWADGYVSRLDALAIGQASVVLGAGRATKADSIDHAAGIVCRRKHGEAVSTGDRLAEVHGRDAAAVETCLGAVAAAYEIRPEAPTPRPLVLESLG